MGCNNIGYYNINLGGIVMKKMISILLTLTLVFALVGCSGGGKATNLQIGQVDFAAHGSRSFSITTVLLEGDKIVDVFIDEYQYLSADTTTGVPNSDAGFGGNYAEGVVLGSKRVNDAAYSQGMAEKAEATITIAKNLDAIQDFARGKTISEVEELVAKGDEAVDAVSGCTLVDTAGYADSIVAAAKAAKSNKSVEYKGDASKLRIKREDVAAYGERGFATVSVVKDGDKIVTSYLDEFQYLDDTEIGVANSEGMATNVVEGKVLASKRTNNTYYSANMADKADATATIVAGFDAIQDHVNGKTAKDLEDLAAKDVDAVVDAISGCTLTGAPGYIGAFAKVAK